MPHRSSTAQPWRLAESRYKLTATVCPCGNIDFPPRNVCSKCSGTKLDIKTLTGNGVIESFTIIHTAPEGFEGNVPYAVALIRLQEGPIITSQVVGDLSDLEIGKNARSVFRKLFEDGKEGLIHYGFKFEIS